MNLVNQRTLENTFDGQCAVYIQFRHLTPVCLTMHVRVSPNPVNLVNLDIQSQAMAKAMAKRGPLLTVPVG